MSQLRLYLLRHAKAVPGTGGIDDFDRPLAPAGRDAMAKAGTIVAREGYSPEFIICSSSRRTRETLALLLPFMPAEATISVTRKVYEFDTDRLAALLAETDPAVRSAMIVGHHPAIEELARRFVRESDAQETDLTFATSALAVIDIEAQSWRDIRPKSAKLVAFHVPR